VRPTVLAATLAMASSASSGSACSPTGPRDVVPESHDVRDGRESDAPLVAQQGHVASPPHDSYAYVARRPHAVIGLIGAKNMSLADATRIANLVADELESCAAKKERDGALAVGAASLVLVATARGAMVSDLRLAPGGPVAANALECLIAPARTMHLQPRTPSTDTAITALAMDATWNPIVAGATDAAGSKAPVAP